MTLQAAAEGQGVALSSVVCADRRHTIRKAGGAVWIAAGVTKTDYAFDLVYSAALAETRPVATFRAWAKSEARDSNAADRPAW